MYNMYAVPSNDLFRAAILQFSHFAVHTCHSVWPLPNRRKLREAVRVLVTSVLGRRVALESQKKQGPPLGLL